MPADAAAAGVVVVDMGSIVVLGMASMAAVVDTAGTVVDMARRLVEVGMASISAVVAGMASMAAAGTVCKVEVVVAECSIGRAWARARTWEAAV
jgi:hypothetical protein